MLAEFSRDRLGKVLAEDFFRRFLVTARHRSGDLRQIEIEPD